MRVIIPFILCICICCTPPRKVMQTTDSKRPGIMPVFDAQKPMIVYKTKANYNNLVPVILSDDKSEIVSYPHPNDIKTESGYQTPIALHNGYLLDRRGISKNIAFLNITYDEYSKLKEVPTIKKLYNSIIDKDPLIELCSCGREDAFFDPVSQLNELIDSNKLRSVCKKTLRQNHISKSRRK